MSDLKATVVALARERGFDLVGVTSADDFAADREAALERIRDGRMDGLPWYTESRVMRGTSPSELLPGARSVICLGLSYLGEEQPQDGRPSTSSGRRRIRTEAGQTDGGSRHRGLDSRFRRNDGEAVSEDGNLPAHPELVEGRAVAAWRVTPGCVTTTG